MPFRAGTSEIVAHALHLMALAGAPGTSPAYAKLDRRARKGSRHARSTTPRTPDASIRDALARREAPSEDAGWFHLRWSRGEAEAMGSEARRLAAEAKDVPDAGLLPRATVEVLASTALRFIPFACSEPWRVALGHEAPGALAVLAVLAERMRPAVQVGGLDPLDEHLLRLHAAGTALARALGGVDPAAPWLHAASGGLLESLGSDAGFAYDRWVQRVATTVLDQPPGEVERIAEGFANRRATRLERSWRRGFFLPPRFDLDAWIAEARD
ncbi:MAG: hypothetical protein ACQEXJ_24745 [Myxococcota bacterium]